MSFDIQSGFSLIHHNTFGFDQQAEYFADFHSLDELHQALDWARSQTQPIFTLGGGSNIVLSQDIPGLTIHSAMNTISILKPESDSPQDKVRIYCDAGVVWNDLVSFSVERELYGIENLALIPGLTGAAPVQNIGAYGAELADTLIAVDVIDKHTGSKARLTKQDCQFAYRHSLFKTPAGNHWIITGLELELAKPGQPNLSYQALRDEVERRQIASPSAVEISQIVAAIRRSKLPDPSDIGNAGSFFKNPSISTAHYNELKRLFPGLPGHESHQSVKVSAAWLIDNAGWKGKRTASVGVHHQQALVLVHHGGGDAGALLALAQEIKNSVKKLYDIALEQEPVTI